MRLRDTLPSQCSLSRCYPITKNSAAAEDYVCFSFIAIIVNPISCPLMGTICILIEASLGSLYCSTFHGSSWLWIVMIRQDTKSLEDQMSVNVISVGSFQLSWSKTNWCVDFSMVFRLPLKADQFLWCSGRETLMKRMSAVVVVKATNTLSSTPNFRPKNWQSRNPWFLSILCSKSSVKLGSKSLQL